MTTRRSGWLESRHDLAPPHELLGRRGRLTASMYAIGCIPSRRDTSDVSSRCQDRARSTSRCRYPTLPVSVQLSAARRCVPVACRCLAARARSPAAAVQCSAVHPTPRSISCHSADVLLVPSISELQPLRACVFMPVLETQQRSARQQTLARSALSALGTPRVCRS